MEQQRQLWQNQQSSLQVLESWLLQWPTAAHKAQENPQLPAKITTVTATDGTTVATVGWKRSHRWEQNFLMTQLHQLLREGLNQARVKVRYTGYCQEAALPSQGESHLRVLVMLERLLTIVL